jgi:hypothetical protein
MSNHCRPENINGYEHPSEHMYTSRNGVYKTFTEGQKYQEDFGNVIVGKQYAVNSDLNDDKCPECKGNAIRTCQCGYSDKTCSNGHVWYTDRDGKPKKGNPH